MKVSAIVRDFENNRSKMANFHVTSTTWAKILNDLAQNRCMTTTAEIRTRLLPKFAAGSTLNTRQEDPRYRLGCNTSSTCMEKLKEKPF